MITLTIILIIALSIGFWIIADTKQQLAEQKRQKLIERTMQSPFGEWRRERENEDGTNQPIYIETTIKDRRTRKRIARRKNKKSEKNRKTFLYRWINAINNSKERL